MFVQIYVRKSRKKVSEWKNVELKTLVKKSRFSEVLGNKVLDS